MNFATSRRGLENDPGLVPLLHQHAGVHFAGRTEDSSIKRLGIAVLPPVLTTALILGFFVWVLGRTSKGHLLTFRRGLTGKLPADAKSSG